MVVGGGGGSWASNEKHPSTQRQSAYGWRHLCSYDDPFGKHPPPRAASRTRHFQMIFDEKPSANDSRRWESQPKYKEISEEILINNSAKRREKFTGFLQVFSPI